VDEKTPSSLAARLAFVVGRLNRRLIAATGGLSHGLLSALATISKQGPIRLADLAQVELVSAPSITRVVAELEARGLVARKTDPLDGRAFLIEMTDDGTDAIARARSARAGVVAELLTGLSESEVQTIEAALPALEHAIEK
jgi:DNA-binding MarR family transcriptional regulator